MRELARNMGIPAGPFYRGQNAKAQINDAKSLTKRENTSTAVTPFEAVSAAIQQRGERHVERMAGVSERSVDHIETMGGPEILGSIDQIEKLDKVAHRTFGLNDGEAHGEQVLVNIALLST